MSSDLLILCYPSLALSLSHHQGLFNELVLCISWPKYWSFSFSISLSVDAEIWFQVQPAQVSSEVTRSVFTSVLATIAIAASAQTWYKKNEN